MTKEQIIDLELDEIQALDTAGIKDQDETAFGTLDTASVAAMDATEIAALDETGAADVVALIAALKAAYLAAGTHVNAMHQNLADAASFLRAAENYKLVYELDTTWTGGSPEKTWKFKPGRKRIIVPRVIPGTETAGGDITTAAAILDDDIMGYLVDIGYSGIEEVV